MQNLYLLGGFFEGLFWLLLSWEPEIYLYIGITSLYLNHSTGGRLLQDGIFHKSAPKLLWKTQNPWFPPIFPLTFFAVRGILIMLGRLASLSVCIQKETLI